MQKEKNSKESRAIKKAERKALRKTKGWWIEFKKFISRGSVIDMAVGVVIGGAFNAIVTSLVGILLSISTWGVPGGLNGLVTILPALNNSQKAPMGWLNSYSAADFTDKATEIGAGSSQAASLFMDSYIKKGDAYFYNGAALIDWGSFINAIITFLIIALTLFIILKVYNFLQKKRAELEEKAREEHYKKHPELRPAPVEPGVPEPTQMDVLSEIRDLLKEQKPKV